MAIATQTQVKPQDGLTDDQRAGISQILTRVLADEFVLYTKFRNYHWNVTGPQFRSLHELFEEQYDELEEIIDDTAERIRTYGHNAIGTMDEFKQTTRLSEAPGEYPDARTMVTNLTADHEQIIRDLREDIETVGSDHGDVGAEDFLTGLLQQHRNYSARDEGVPKQGMM